MKCAYSQHLGAPSRLGLCLATVLASSWLCTEASAAPTGAISGAVRETKTSEPIKDAIVVLQCTCIGETRQELTNAAGLFAFRGLPAGRYTIQVLRGKADVSKISPLERGQKLRANFTIAPQEEDKRVIHVRPVFHAGSATGIAVTGEEMKKLPVGGTGRDALSGAASMAATATETAAGISLAGTTAVETQYTVEGHNFNNPATGQVGSSIVQEFVSAVEVQEGGYDAEFGRVSGGQVQVRRISGSNRTRGTARFTFTPRLAKPRFILSTDEALRVTATPDYQLQGVIAASGPIVKDRLFWSAGIEGGGTTYSLNQSFYHRVDKDGSGGYDDCPHENGANDCVDGGNFIASKKFADQKFKTRRLSMSYVLGLDWAINPKHRIRLTGVGGPGFSRRSYRLPFSFEPAAFGTNPLVDPLGGATRVATGIINEGFGWDMQNAFQVSTDYNGRLLSDRLELDAGVAYSQYSFREAWKVDDPGLRDLPAMEANDTQGRNLLAYLDQENARALVPGVEQACNDPDLPGVACPIRTWRSGGIGQYGTDIQRVVEGKLSFTHFFAGAGSHQLKYGTQIDHLQNESKFQFSGSNSADFYQDCPTGQVDGGEYCFDPSSGAYNIDMSQQVNNRRFVVVSSNNPDNHATVGYGRVRKEEGELRAISTALGAGARVDEYHETVSTQNYGIYLQDRWALLNNLYLSGGVRWEIQDMRDILGRRAVFIWDNVAPRVGIVYDWTQEGKSRLYGSYGWFYQQLPLRLNSRVFGGRVDVVRNYRASDCRGGQVAIRGAVHDQWADGQPTEYCVDFPTVTSGLTEGAVVPRLRGQYNEQLQLGYEQEVIEDLVLGVRWIHRDLGRAVEDVSTDGGINFLIANPGEDVSREDIASQQQRCDDLNTQLLGTGTDDPDRPGLARDLQRCEFLVNAYENIGENFVKPTSNYDAFTFQLQKRFAKNWLLMASYTYSRLVGNYDGYVDPITGAVNLGSSTQYDLPDLVRNSFGPLSMNIPHRVRVFGFYTLDLREAGRVTFGTSVNYSSGLPISLRAAHARYPGQFPTYVVPRGAGGRVEPNYQWNLSFGYAYPLPGQLELEFGARLLNVTNAKSVLRVDEVYSFERTRPIAGGGLSDLKHAKVQSDGRPTEFFNRDIVAPQGNFGVETQFQNPLAAQFELQLRF